SLATLSYPSTPYISPLSLHDALPIYTLKNYKLFKNLITNYQKHIKKQIQFKEINKAFTDKFKNWLLNDKGYSVNYAGRQFEMIKDRKSTRLNSSHVKISYAVFCLKKK